MKLSAVQRRCLSEFVIGLSICGGAYYFIVQPMNRSLLEARAKVSRLTSEGKAHSAQPSLSPDQIASLLAQTRDRVSSINAAGLYARDQGAMFSAVSALAEKLSVRIDQLQPANLAKQPAAAPPPGAPPAPPDPALPPPPKDTLVAFTINARGTYLNLAAFVDALRHELGFTHIAGMRITPSGTIESPEVIATIQTEHLSVDVSALDKLLGSTAVTDASPGSGGAP